jgi:iron(III) transport system substrate-binding protein
MNRTVMRAGRKPLQARWRVSVLAATIATTLVATACGSSNSKSSASASQTVKPTTALQAWNTAPQSLIDAAKAEGTLTVYSGNVTIPQTATEFQKEYGIKVTYIEGSSTNLESRYTAEAQSGKVQADVIMAGYSSFYDTSLTAGYLLPINQVIPGFTQNYPSQYQYDNGNFGVYLLNQNGFVYNTSLVTGSNIPTNYTDFTKPYWKGKLISVNPNDSIAFLQFWDFILKKFGADTVKAIGANINAKQMQSSFPPEAQSVSAGEGSAALLMTQSAMSDLVAKGAPLKYVSPPLATGPTYVAGVSAKAPHSAAAQLFAYWLYTPKGQAFQAQINVGLAPLGGGNLGSFYTPNPNAETEKAQIDSLLGVGAGTT